MGIIERLLFIPEFWVGIIFIFLALYAVYLHIKADWERMKQKEK